MRRRELLACLLTALSAGCAGAAADVPPPATGPARTRREARMRLADLAQRYEKLMSEHGAYEYGRYAGTLKEGPASEAILARLRAEERDLFAEAKAVLARFGQGLVSPRRAQLWQRGALGLELLGDPRSAELSDRLEAIVNGWELVLDGKKVPRRRLIEMRLSEDAGERRRTRTLEWELHRAAAPVAKELMIRRRDLARKLGRESFWSAMLEVRGADPKQTSAIVDELDRRSARPFALAFSGGGRLFGRRSLAPWDVDFTIQKLAPTPEGAFPAERALDGVLSIFHALGFDLKRKLDLRVRDFAFGGQTIAVHVPDDVRLVVRQVPGMKFVSLLLHELGHAVAVMSTATEEPLYKGYEWVPGLTEPAWDEGLAETFAHLLDEPEVLRRFFGLSARDAETVARGRRLEALAGIRRGLTAIRFERAALEAPDGDLDRLSLEIERRFSAMYLPRDAEPTWAASALLATYPVYVQSYTLGACIAAQVRAALVARFGAQWLSPRAGKFLVERMLADGSRLTTKEKLVRGTGSPLEASALLRYLVGP
jgi:hypothetical protein